ncbi:Clavaminate synthase [Fusarium beomiforme]|uniref:Clavaminate synthase n=1 Tax=Fusarium beomiforme TaxID=44412 RepID=A0A9P5ARN1_9HYPO|nr:Clavaminate synthase [Fusarium beomiforme]
MKHDVDAIGPWKLNGYTPFRRNEGLAGDGKKYGMEGYTFPRDAICNPIKGEHGVSLPPVLQQETPLLASFMDQLHEIGACVQTRPRRPVDLLYDRPAIPSLSTESSNAGLNAHTDVGSLVILFCDARGMQTFNQDS